MLEASLADSTMAAYTRALRLYTAFCRQRSLPDVPASIETIAAFLLHGHEQGLFQGAALRQFSAALRKTHIWRGYPPPQSNPVVADLFAGYQKLTQVGVQRLRRVPLLVPDALRLAIGADAALRSGDLLTARDSVLIIFQFFTFARASTVAQQRLSDVALNRSRISLRLGHEKNWLATNRVITLRRTTTEEHTVHPWDVLARYIQAVSEREWKYLFAVHTRLAYNQVAHCWRRALARAQIEPDSGVLLPHSARSGGASAAAALGAPTVAIAQRGGWRSVNSVISYVHPVTRVAGDTLFFGDLQPTATPINTITPVHSSH